MDEERLKQAARVAAEILAQAKVTAARASQTLDRGKEARTVAAEALSRARRAEVWAEAAIGRIREMERDGLPPDDRPPGNGHLTAGAHRPDGTLPDGATPPEPPREVAPPDDPPADAAPPGGAR